MTQACPNSPTSTVSDQTSPPVARHYPLRDPICPEWCVGHDRDFQPWEIDASGDGFREHASHLPMKELSGVMLCLAAHERPGDRPPLEPHIQVLAQEEGLPLILGATQARQVAAGLVVLAEQAEGWAR